MGIEVGIMARLLWPGGVLIDTKYDDVASTKIGRLGLGSRGPL